MKMLNLNANTDHSTNRRKSSLESSLQPIDGPHGCLDSLTVTRRNRDDQLQQKMEDESRLSCS